MNNPPPIPIPEVRAVIVRPHRAQKILILAVIGFAFGPCAAVAMWMSKRDLQAMAARTMDRSGESLTRLGRGLAIAAGIVWLVKWTIAIIVGIVLYLSWSALNR